MADFFTRMVERAMGQTAGVRPDYPATLSPANDVAMAEDGVTAPRQRQESKAATDFEKPSAEKPPAERQHERPISEADPELVSETDTIPLTPRGEASVTTQPNQRRVPALSDSTIAAPIVALAVESWSTPARQQPPTIQVSIGRVEVRAVTPMPSAIPQRSVGRREPVRLSLDDYLRQRNEGRR